MKIVSSWTENKSNKTYQQKEVLRLLYGKEEPPESDRKLVPLLTQTFVAKLTKLPLGRVNYLVHSYFNQFKEKPRQSLFVPKYRSKPKGRSIATRANLTPEEAEFIISQENLQKWACVPILGRCILFHRNFPDRWISNNTYARVMREAGITEKVIRVHKRPQH